MPATSVPNSSGAMIIRIMRMKIWLNGRMMLAYQAAVASSNVLMYQPTIRPTTRPIMICMVGEMRGFRRCRHSWTFDVESRV